VVITKLYYGRHTVQRYARAVTWQEMVHGRWDRPRASILDAFTAHLQRRMDDGCGNVLQLFREIQTLGYTGSYSTLRDRRPLRPPLPPPPPSAREVTNWLTRRPDTLTDSEQIHVTDLTARCSQLRLLRGPCHSLRLVPASRRRHRRILRRTPHSRSTRPDPTGTRRSARPAELPAPPVLTQARPLQPTADRRRVVSSSSQRTDVQRPSGKKHDGWPCSRHRRGVSYSVCLACGMTEERRIEVMVNVGDRVSYPYLTPGLLDELLPLPDDPPFLVLKRAEEVYAQTYRHDDGSYDLEYRDGSADQHYWTCVPDIRLAFSLLWMWTKEDQQWRTLWPWERIEV
jgi:hypothetical protein